MICSLFLIIIFYAFHTKEVREYENAILKQQDVIQSQQNLIRIYEMYYDQLNRQPHDFNRFNKKA